MLSAILIHNGLYLLTLEAAITHFDQAYYAARLRQNERLAATACNAGIRDLHLQYVRMYQSLLDGTAQATRGR